MKFFAGFLAVALIAFLGFTSLQFHTELKKARNDLDVAQQEAQGRDQGAEAEAKAAKAEAEKATEELEKVKASATASEQAAGNLRGEVQTLRAANAQLTQENQTLRQQVQEADELKSTLENDLKSQLKSKDVTIEQLKGKLNVNILNSVLFDLGQAELKQQGRDLLGEVGKALEEYPNRQIHVIGHTDNNPFKRSTGRFRNNWELSAGRAVAAVRFLQDSAGIDPRRLAAVGYSEYHPIADNSTAEGQAQNRRITLVIMPEELAVTPEKPAEAAPDPDADADGDTPTTGDETTNAKPDADASGAETEAEAENEKPGDAVEPNPAEDGDNPDAKQAAADAQKQAMREKLAAQAAAALDAAKKLAEGDGATNATPPAPVGNSDTNVALPKRSGSSGGLPLPKIPMPKATPESAPKPKG